MPLDFEDQTKMRDVSEAQDGELDELDEKETDFGAEGEATEEEPIEHESVGTSSSVQQYLH